LVAYLEIGARLEVLDKRVNLAIATNPHLEGKKQRDLWNTLEDRGSGSSKEDEIAEAFKRIEERKKKRNAV